jgi:hypothetical protein
METEVKQESGVAKALRISNLMRRGIRRHENVTKDGVEFHIYGKAVPLLLESVFPHRGIPTAGMHGTEIHCHIIRVDWRPSEPAAWSLGKTGTRQKHSSLEVSPGMK